MARGKRIPGFLYCKEHLDGVLFTDEEKYEKALRDGWLESPKDALKTPEQEVREKLDRAIVENRPTYPRKKKRGK